MTDHLDDLLIHQEELDNLVYGTLITHLSLTLYRGLFLKNKNQLFSLLQTEFFTFIVILIFVFPVTLIFLRSQGNIFQQQSEINQLILIVFCLCLGLLLLINIYLWQQSKKHKSLAILIEKTDQYNNLIKAVKLVESLESITPSNGDENQTFEKQDLINTLTMIKQGLIQGLTLEKLIRKQGRLIEQHYQLLTNLDSNLSALMDIDLNHPSSQYQKILQDAIQIGMTVHKEIKKLQN
ncbi:hypothetical protein PCC7424_3090 [Gloeothece citriformis PCC 7424]|uniref:Uncharacterized protein n=1 Tax=Gloeothece citriformis (strain PCC 7424) TaxID=65393 RepID=B7KBD6_GLOC7|nr:hypothetical protein [Gloeothece citriformis]ACK71492.1 hypothetical protein PCC7424_3090 [Gloeothece citriformis PCC 7424]